MEQEKDCGGEVNITTRKIHSALPTVECGINNNRCDKGFEVISNALTTLSYLSFLCLLLLYLTFSTRTKIASFSG